MTRYIFPRIVEKSGPPTANDDSSRGNVNGQPLFDTTNIAYYICVDNTVGSAKWVNITYLDFLVKQLTDFMHNTWTIGQVYHVGDVVTFNNVKLICVHDHIADTTSPKMKYWRLFRDNWETGTNYTRDEVMVYNEQHYICYVTHTSSGNTPDLDAYWRPLYACWVTGYRYHVGDRMFYNGINYICIQDHTSTGDAPNLNYWVVYRGDWKPGINYEIGDIITWDDQEYICIEDHTSTGTEPDMIYWNKFTGTWRPNTYYHIGDVMVWDDTMYVCIEDHLSSGTEPNMDYWTEMGAPIAEFSSNTISGTVPLTASFTNESSGSITSYQWSFGDGTTSTQENPSHTYTIPGLYTVSLVVTGPSGSHTRTKTNYINVSVEAPLADFSANQTTGAYPFVVAFTDESIGNISSYEWNFGDGSSSTDRHPSHTYTDQGGYTVTLTVTGPGGSDTETKTNYITVTAQEPVCAFAADTTTGASPLVVNFSDNSTGTINSWVWNFGDGNTSSERNPSHTFINPGQYDVRLTVTGPGGSDSLLKSDYINVSADAPSANFTSNTSSGSSPLVVSFTNTSTGNISTYAWDFGDGNTSTSANPTYTYTNPGQYTVKLTVTGPGGSDIELKTNYINVSEPVPVAQFTSDVTTGNMPLAVDFTNQSSGNIISYSWDFGDGTSATDQNPSHTYSIPGTYTVSLTVTGPGGSDTETKTNYITVNAEVPVASFSISPTSGDAPLTVNFTNTSTGGAITSYSWNFGDNQTSTEQNPTHVYNTPNTYTVTLTVTGPGGSDTTTNTVMVNEAIPPYIEVTNDQVFDIAITNWSGGTWTIPDGWTAQKVYSDTALELKHNLGANPLRWSGCNLQATPQSFIVSSSSRDMEVVDENTIRFKQIAVSNEFDLNVIFDKSIGSNPSILTRYKLEVNDWTNNQYTIPDGWTVTRTSTGNGLDITHNKDMDIDDWSSPDFNSDVFHNLQIQNSNKCTFPILNNVGNTFTIYLYFAE